MPDWKSPAELQLEGAIFAKFIHALLGLYAYVALIVVFFGFLNSSWIIRYEFFLSLDFDWEFLSGKKRFRWPLVKYSFCWTAFLFVLTIQYRSFISPIDIFCWCLLLECEWCDLMVNFRWELSAWYSMHSAIALDTQKYDPFSSTRDLNLMSIL